MRFYLAGLLLLAALNVAQAQDYLPLDTSERVQLLDPPPADDTSQATLTYSTIILDGSDRAVLLGQEQEISRYGIEWINPAALAASPDDGLTDEALTQFACLYDIPADKPRSIAVCLDRLKNLQDAYTRLYRLDEAEAVRLKLAAYKAGKPGMPSKKTVALPALEINATIRVLFTAQSLDADAETVSLDALPQAAKELLAKLRQSKAEAGNKAQTQEGLRVLRNMETAYAGACQLAPALALRDARLHFVGDSLGAVPNPGALMNYRGKVGQSFYFYVRGHAAGSVWGDGLYTDDSTLGAVAVHAGLLRKGQKGLVKVTFRPGRESYDGTERNGVISQSYAAWQGSYTVEAVRF